VRLQGQVKLLVYKTTGKRKEVRSSRVAGSKTLAQL